MKSSDYWMVVIFGGFGLWWVLFPSSVIRFYRWFHGGRVVIPKASGVRIAGLLWLILVLGVSSAVYFISLTD